MTATATTTTAPPPRGGRRERPTSSTPEQLQRLTAMVAVASVAFAALAFLGLGRTADRAERLRDLTGPVLVAAQDVRASLAEANAAQSTAYLALPDEDLTSLRSYRDALDRATGQLAEVAARTDGDGGLLEAAQDVGSEVTRFAGLVEAARATRGLAGGDEEELDDETLAGRVATEGDALLVAAQAQLAGPVDTAVEQMVERADADLDTGLDVLTLAVLALGVVVVVLVVVASVRLAGLTRRVVNPGLLVAAIALVAGVAWLATSTVSAQARLDEATRDGYATIQLTAQLQQEAFGEQARAVAAAVAPDADLTALGEAVDEAVLDDRVAAIARRADGPREEALAEELAVRHERWQTALDAARSDGAAAGGGRAAQAVTAEPFRGFVFALDGVVADNRDQFLAGLDDAAAPLGLLPLALLVLGLASGAAGVLGIRPRLQEYR